MMDNHININLILAGRSYKLKVKPAEESAVRQAAKDINDQIQSYHQQFPGKDNQDFLSMLLLQQKVESLQNNSLQSEMDDWDKKLDTLDSLLTASISNR